MQRDGSLNADVNKITPCGWSNWMNMTEVRPMRNTNTTTGEEKYQQDSVCSQLWRQCRCPSHVRRDLTSHICIRVDGHVGIH